MTGKKLGAAFVGALALVGTTTGARAALLLSDNFTGDGNPNTFDVNFNLAGRQGGSLAPRAYSVTGNTQVGNVATMRTAPPDGNYLLMAFSGTVSPDHDFKNSSAGGLDISFDVAPDNDVNTDEWTAINLGMPAANRSLFINQNIPHFGVLFRADGRIQAFDGPNVVSNEQLYGPPNQGGTNNNFHPVRLRLTDPTDGDPFNGVGQTTIDIFSSQVNGGATPIYSFTKTGGGYADGFMAFSSISIGGIDNLQITQVPEPVGMAALGLIGLAMAAVPRRRCRGGRRLGF
jgi:hypothetical protein